MTPAPVRVRPRRRPSPARAGATLVAGHSAHVFHGVDDRVCTTWATSSTTTRLDPVLRNDLGLLFLVDARPRGPRQLEALPLKLTTAYRRGDGRRARGRDRFRGACRGVRH